jgi:cardiolipin synthase
MTRPEAPVPSVWAKGNQVRVQFGSADSPVVFAGAWKKLRVPTKGFAVNSVRLKLVEDGQSLNAKSWRSAVVLAGKAWSEMLLDSLDQLAPLEPGQGIYYQSYLADGVIFRDKRGTPVFRPLNQTPSEITIQRRLSIDETIEVLANVLGASLSQQHPGKKLFVVLSPSSRDLVQGLLLDLEKKQTVWLSPAALYDRSDRGFDLLLTARGLSALTLESHGLALLKNPVSSAARLMDFGVQTAWRFLRVPRPQIPREAPDAGSTPGMDLEEWEKWLDRYTGTVQQNGDLRLLIDGNRFFPELQEAICTATNSIKMDVYIFDTDDVAVHVADQLKARAGSVKTQVIIDRMGSLASGASPPGTPLPETFQQPISILKHLRSDSAVEVRPYLNPWMSTDHTKIYIVDGARAWLGGMNLGREYRYEWHDMMVEVRGGFVQSLEKDFSRAWAHESWLGDAAYLGALLKPDAEPAAAGGAMKLRLLPTKTGWKPFSAAVFGALRNAKNHVYIENPYLFDKRVTAALVHARRRGVDVRVILPRVNDFKAGARSNLVTANYLLQHGVRVYFYPGMTHAKALLVDGWACVGSANLNHLSLRLCREHNIATSDKTFVDQLRAELFETDFAKSYEMTSPIRVGWADFLTDLALENL